MRRNRERVLLLDDHAGSRLALSRALRSRGHECLAVGTADAALAAIETSAPTVVVLEWKLTAGDGAGLAARLRSESLRHNRRLLVVALSYVNQPELGEDFDAYVIKPALPEDIETAFQQAAADQDDE